MPDLLGIGILFLILGVVYSGLKNESISHLAKYGTAIYEKPRKTKR